MPHLHKIIRGLTIFFAGVLLTLVFVRFFILKSKKELPNNAPSQYGTLGEFSFLDQKNKIFKQSDMDGSFWVVDFIFTRCMGPCPLLTTQMARLVSEFPRTDLKFASISVDPNFDTPAVLSKYANSYGADLNRWIFLTGKKEEIYEFIKSSFHLAVESDQKNPLDVVHSLSFVLVGKKGEILGYFNATDSAALQELREKIKSLK